MNEKMLEISTNEARQKISDQLSAVDAADQKIGILLGFVGVAITLLFDGKNRQGLEFLLYFCAQSSLIVSFTLLLFAHRSIRLDTGLSIKGYYKIIKEFSAKNDVVAFLNHQLAYFEEAVKTNNKLIGDKISYIAYATWAILIGLLFYAVSYLN